MLKNVYEGLNACSKVYSSKVYFCEMYPSCVSSKLCEFISIFGVSVGDWPKALGITILTTIEFKIINVASDA